MTEIAEERLIENIAAVRARIAQACEVSGRGVDEVLLVAAAKTVGPQAVQAVVDAGVTAIGENYVSELVSTGAEVQGARWHYIGALQTSTAHKVADHADVVETLSSERAVARLARRAASAGRTLEGLIEVDFTGRRTGAAPGDVPRLAETFASTPGIRLVGLMTVPPLGESPEDARPWFARLRELREKVRENLPDVLELSMGMSLDYSVAIQEGATIVRVGTALFGSRSQ